MSEISGKFSCVFYFVKDDKTICYEDDRETLFTDVHLQDYFDFSVDIAPPFEKTIDAELNKLPDGIYRVFCHGSVVYGTHRNIDGWYEFDADYSLEFVSINRADY